MCQMQCRQCGNESQKFDQGVCVECCEENQRRLDIHNAEYDHWKKQSDTNRSDAIKRAYGG